MHVARLIRKAIIGLTMTTDGKYTHLPRVYHVILFNTTNGGQICEAYRGCYIVAFAGKWSPKHQGRFTTRRVVSNTFFLIGLPKCGYKHRPT